jgi:glycosyltransferase involved in cell wall biosynthesis
MITEERSNGDRARPGRLRVGLDVTALLNGDGGVARYVREIGAVLEDHDVDLVRFAVGRGPHQNSLPQDTRWLRTPLRAVHRSWAWAGRPAAPRLAPGCTVMHTPDLLPPPTKLPLVLTVHDLVALEHPGLHPRRSVALQRAQLRAAIASATVVVAVSRATADRLEVHGVNPDRIVVAPNGATRLPVPDPSCVPVGPYFLAVGSVTPRKGFETLVEAFARASLPDDVRLVLAGSDGWAAADVHAAIDRHRGPGRVICTGRVTDAQLAALYDRCIATCIPSVAEGFGLPVVEAAVAGAPVIASDLPVFREITDAVVLLAPSGDAPAWAAALEYAFASPELRARAAGQSLAVASQYSWKRSAALTLAAYERALRERWE